MTFVCSKPSYLSCTSQPLTAPKSSVLILRLMKSKDYSGLQQYDNGDVQAIVTSEISREEFPAQVPPSAVVQHAGETKQQTKHSRKKKPFKKVAKKRSRPKPQNERDKKGLELQFTSQDAILKISSKLTDGYRFARTVRQNIIVFARALCLCGLMSCVNSLVTNIFY